MEIVQGINSTYNEVNRNLIILEREGIILQQFLGRRRIIQLNFENKKTMPLVEIIKTLDSLYKKNKMQ